MRQSPIGNGFTIPDVARADWPSGMFASFEKIEITWRRKLLEDPFVLPPPDFFAFIRTSTFRARH
jgi:hypothetical protein